MLRVPTKSIFYWTRGVAFSPLKSNLLEPLALIFLTDCDISRQHPVHLLKRVFSYTVAMKRKNEVWQK